MAEFRRTSTGAIININEIELKNARLKKEIKNKKKDRVEELEKRLDKLESDFKEYVYRTTDDGK